MILYIGSVIFYIIGIILQTSGVATTDLVTFIYALGIGMFVIAIIMQEIMYATLYSRVKKIGEHEEDKKIYERRAKILIEECKEPLKGIYPNTEKEIFNSLASTKTLLSNFPEIKSHSTILKLIDMIDKNKDNVFEIETDIIRLKREVRARKKVAKFWIYASRLPDYR